MLTEDRSRSRTWAAVCQRCPICRRGPIFHGLARMYEHCPVCGVKFEREEGYFLGAMYISYALSIPLLAVVFFVGLWLLPGWPDMAVAGLATAVFLPLVPLIFRYSRVLWIHYDRWAWPGG